MNGNDCDTVRDLLPLLGHDELRPRDEAWAQEHLTLCADCREEAGLVHMIQSTLDPLPAGLEARVLAAVRDAAAARHAEAVSGGLTARRRRVTTGRLARAATLAAAVIGGALVVERVGGPWSEAARGNGSDFDVPATSLLSWAAADDAMLHGGMALDELTVEELELLIEELES